MVKMQSNNKECLPGLRKICLNRRFLLSYSQQSQNILESWLSFKQLTFMELWEVFYLYYSSSLKQENCHPMPTQIRVNCSLCRKLRRMIGSTMFEQSKQAESMCFLISDKILKQKKILCYETRDYTSKFPTVFYCIKA